MNDTAIEENSKSLIVVDGNKLPDIAFKGPGGISNDTYFIGA